MPTKSERARKVVASGWVVANIDGEVLYPTHDGAIEIAVFKTKKVATWARKRSAVKGFDLVRVEVVRR